MAGIPPPRVIGHRGAAALAPENTFAGFRTAKALGLQWVEFDVQASRDGHPFLLHDARLERTTDGRGVAVDHRLAELERLDAGRWFAPSFRGEPIPRLEAVLALLSELEMGAVIEIKAARGDGARTMRAALPALARHDPERIILSSFDEAVLSVAAAEMPHVPRALGLRSIGRDWQARIERFECDAAHVSARWLGRAAVAMVAREIPCRVFTVNAPARARQLLAWGAAGVFTDCPDVILSAIGHRPVRVEPPGEKRN